ncbi:MAG: hypothetical protein IT307_06580 [Chloroflexi bacterium]|nr:hypothetical protein [Chloroflexota bacterium]
MANEAYIDVREAILGLRESVAHEAGLTGALGQYLQKFTRQSGISAKLLVREGTRTRFSSGREVQLVRIIQEALTNVRKHSGAHRAWVRFEGVNGSVRISIQDDGRGFDAARLSDPADHGFGLQTMAERAERVGGTLEIDSNPAKGTRVTVCLPAEREEAVNGAH